MKELVVLILWVREDNTVFEGRLGVWWKKDGNIDWPRAAGAAVRPSEGFFTVHDGAG